MSEDFKEAHKVALAFIKYRNGQIHLFDFEKYAGISVGDAIKKFPFIQKCYLPELISKAYKDWHGS